MSQLSANRGVMIGLTKLFCKIKSCTETSINVLQTAGFYVLYAAGHLAFTYILSGILYHIVQWGHSLQSTVCTQTFQQNKLTAGRTHSNISKGLAPPSRLAAGNATGKLIFCNKETEAVAERYVVAAHKPQEAERYIVAAHKPQVAERYIVAAHKPQVPERYIVAAHKPQVAERYMVAAHKPQVAERYAVAAHKPQVAERYVVAAHKPHPLHSISSLLMSPHWLSSAGRCLQSDSCTTAQLQPSAVCSTSCTNGLQRSDRRSNPAQHHNWRYGTHIHWISGNGCNKMKLHITVHNRTVPMTGSLLLRIHHRCQLWKLSSCCGYWRHC
jgi:hypothetical protein